MECTQESDCNCSSCFGGVNIPVGPKGDKGDKGNDGAAGATGPQGPVGPEGPAGTTGSEGDPGPQGPAGSVGATGADGADGAVGATGAAGADGNDGVDGTETFFVAGVPGAGLGDDGDIAYDTATTNPQIDIYQKQAGVWVLIGTFGNTVLVAQGAGAEDAYLFKAKKTVDQNLLAALSSNIINFEDDSTAPDYFDNAQVWSGFNWKTPQDTTNTAFFTLEMLDIENITAGAINVTVNIRHKDVNGVFTTLATQVVSALAATTTTVPSMQTPTQVFAEDEEVFVELVPAAPAVADDLIAKAGGKFYIQD